jgi:ubiquinone/menaquinone biosynthesis C-methylase UbiE
MLKKIADNRDEQSLAVKFRKRRFAFFNSLLSRLKRPVSILDVGGAETYWKTMGMTAEDYVSVTLLNLTEEDVTLPNLTSIVGDAREIDFADNSFDVVFSNSVIEHVGGYGDQTKMAKEVRRVGKRYFIQTPNKYFPLEPHFLFPFFQFLPVTVRVRLLQSFNLGWFPRTPEPAKAREIVESIRLLGRDEFLELFPDCQLYEEKVFGITKSFVAYEGWTST